MYVISKKIIIEGNTDMAISENNICATTSEELLYLCVRYLDENTGMTTSDEDGEVNNDLKDSAIKDYDRNFLCFLNKELFDKNADGQNNTGMATSEYRIIIFDDKKDCEEMLEEYKKDEIIGGLFREVVSPQKRVEVEIIEISEL